MARRTLRVQLAEMTEARNRIGNARKIADEELYAARIQNRSLEQKAYTAEQETRSQKTLLALRDKELERANGKYEGMREAFQGLAGRVFSS